MFINFRASWILRLRNKELHSLLPVQSVFQNMFAAMAWPQWSDCTMLTYLRSISLPFTIISVMVVNLLVPQNLKILQLPRPQNFYKAQKRVGYPLLLFKYHLEQFPRFPYIDEYGNLWWVFICSGVLKQTLVSPYICPKDHLDTKKFPSKCHLWLVATFF